MIDVAPGLWVWRVVHPDWDPDVGWEPPVTSTVIESRGEVAVLDAIAPPGDASEIWQRLDASPPTLAVVLKPDHVRDVDLFVRRYGVKASSCDPLPLQEPAGSLEKARTIGHDQAPQRHAVRMPARISDGMAASRKDLSRPLREMEAMA